MMEVLAILFWVIVFIADVVFMCKIKAIVYELFPVKKIEPRKTAAEKFIEEYYGRRKL